MNKYCDICDNLASYNERFDARYCAKCNVWLEKACGDSFCYFCNIRPEKPVGKFKRVINKLLKTKKMTIKSKMMICSKCNKEIVRKTGNQKYCSICNGIVNRESTIEKYFQKKNRDINKYNVV